MIDLSYWPFFFLAILGAVVANATGAGGGVVFVPAFTMLSLDAHSIIATSFAIQCFGMSAGTLAWHKHAVQQTAPLLLQEESPTVPHIWSSYWRTIVLFGLPAVVGVLMGQYLLAPESAEAVKRLFKAFSLAFGLVILVTTYWLVKRDALKRDPIPINGLIFGMAIAVAWIGGLITAWLSIGVGELIAVMLILLRFPVRFAIGVAVSVSAICVWFGVQQYLWFQQTIDFNVLMFAGPAALIGGTIAKTVVARFSAVQVKVFIAIWILISAVAM